MRSFQTYLNEGDKLRKYYSCLKLMTQAHLHAGVFLQNNFYKTCIT